ncbi:MAG: hypothetical protein FJ280_21805, partial [Planctomycetes bacterium]|nr:hypothetical protein [Planctomycetota bacterium]
MKSILTLLLTVLAAHSTTAAATLPPLDSYGGATTIKAEATGYFRLQEIQGRWFFVTPDGHAFLVNGINHVGGNVMERLYNRDYWQERYRQQTGATAANPREIFEWKVRRDVQAMGWNAFGSHSHPGFNPRLLPYVKTLRF